MKTGRWVFTVKTHKQGNFLKAEARWVLRCFQDKQKEYQQTDSPASTRPGFRMSCQLAASKGWNIFHIDLKTAFLQGQSDGVHRDVVCQLPPEAGHPPYIAARLKKPAYGMNDSPRRWWNILNNALWNYGMVRTRADRCGYVLYSTQTREHTLHRGTIQITSQLNRVRDHREMHHLRKCWISLKEAQLQANPWQEASIFLHMIY